MDSFNIVICTATEELCATNDPEVGGDYGRG